MTSRADWRRHILEELGGDGVDAELTEAQLDAALARALDLWNKHRPHVEWFPFQVQPGDTSIITFFADPEQTDDRRHPNTYIRNVLDVSFQDANRRIIGVPAAYVGSYYLRWGYEGPRLMFQLQVGGRNYDRLTGSRPDWHWDPEERKLYIYSPNRASNIMALCSRERLLEEVEYHHGIDFLQAATARAKYVLARVLGSRGPFGGAPGALETDAALLREESKAEWQAIVDKLERSPKSYPPALWIG